MTLADDPYGFPNLYTGIGTEPGFVHEYWNPPRSTVGDQNAPGNVLYDLQGNGTEIPAHQEVPLFTVRAVLAAYLDHGGLIPEDFPDLHEVAIV